jgi:predicted small integral membrane protein
MIAMRLSKIVMTGGLAVWAFLVTLGNITDYDTNWAFVQHVLSMDTILPGSSLKWRAITDPTIQRVAYLAIIVTEGLICLAFLAATWLMARRWNADKKEFQRARALTVIGVLLGFGLYFIGFMAVGGEWFAMWQSQTWNGQQAAFRFCLAILAAGVYVFLDTDGDPGRSA